MARRRNSSRRRRGSFSFLYKLLSMLVICGVIIAALTLFFRVDTVIVQGQQRYTEEQVRDASGVQAGDNLYLLNKNAVAQGIVNSLPYIESIRINRKLPDTLLIELTEFGQPVALAQEGKTWIISVSGNVEATGKIVDCQEEKAAEDYGVISGCQLLSPTVGSRMVMATEYSTQQESLLALLTALKNADMLAELDAIRLDELDYLSMDYMERFTVRLPYGADYPYKLRFLQSVIADEKIQDNMTGTFDMRSDDGRVNFIQNVR